ncbi:carbon-nitrogen hydrolase family protein [Microvirga lotononidis]|uniref:Putative amidohydrolase n=1 Tax=Microvirga lotononidis TaxID=864069 RepID=I4Z4C8_9HYPH|nr:carbon-nitrogen hydrolase family protein [Microvirga lotononidis]EIM31070.1 putative amidohydrolase [Microvirga lotononidis]WQO30525.1 carbon-nitrogen hydrolase family protein [Microvirga lotononidis]
MKISFAQFSPIPGDTAATTRLVAAKAREAAAGGARLIAFPECFLTGGSFDDRDSLRKASIDIERGDLEPIVAVGRDTGILIVVGFYQVKGEHAYNTSALIGPNGIIGLHHKMHLPFMIGDRFVDIPAESTPSVFDTPIGRIGMAICYEVRFPEVTRTLALEGADLIVVPAAWPEAARILPDIFTTVRAAENFVFLLAANRNDVDNGMPFMGSSHVIGPDGKQIINAGMSDGIFYCDIEIERARVKSIIRDPGIYEVHPFRDRRPQDYRICALPSVI